MKLVGMEDHGSIIMVHTDSGEIIPFERNQYALFLEQLAGEQGVEPGGTVVIEGEWDYDPETGALHPN